MTFISYAQNGEDVLLWRALGHVDRGHYIDVGAHHPDIDSVTRAFYDRGWSGVNIEPLAEPAAQIAAARGRDVTLRLALGAAPGELPFYEVAGTGLSTLDPAAAEAARAGGHAVRETVVTVRTLAEICRLHAAPEIHFLKIDVEGAERAVLEGADLEAYRPWIILAEATAPLSTRVVHAEWEPLLLAADYAHVWFDGLNRYYVSRERLEQLGGCFQVQPNVFDGYLRASDSGLVRRVDVAETEGRALRAALLEARAAADEQAARGRGLAERTVHEAARLREAVAALRQGERESRAQQAAELAELRWQLLESSHELQHTHLRLQAALQTTQDQGEALREAGQALDRSRAELASTHASRSWRLTAPLRRARTRIVPQHPGPAPGLASPEPVAPAPTSEQIAPPETAAAIPQTPELETPPLPVLPPLPPAALAAMAGGFRAVHQFHSGSAVGDAITNAMLLTRTLLRGMGYRSEIYTERPPAALAHELLPFEAMPRHDGYVLILRHSMGYDRFHEVLALPAPKVLLYHNITPTALLARHPYLARYAQLGRVQLAACRGAVRAALADSDYNAIELRRLGLAPVRTCTLLFDEGRLRTRAAAAATTTRDDRGVFTLLFVGRINAAKGQRELVHAYAAFRARFERPSRLVLVGRDDGEHDPFLQALRRDITALGLEPHVHLTGGIDDDALDRHYAAADLYVSLSRHEGFGVPLVEAMAHGVPVLALAGGAVPYTLAGAGRLLDDAAPAVVAAALLELARDPAAREALRARGTARLADFALDRQRAVLGQALLRAGAALPEEPELGARLDANLRFSIAGHVNGSYSLAAINRDLALALEAARPGRVRLLPVEGTATFDLSGVPAAQAAAIEILARRPPHATGPELVISQHYPVHVPPHPGDLAVALLFWEESLLPAATIATLNANFRAVVAPTRFVQRALLESGLRIPVRVIPPALRLEPFLALRPDRATAGAAPVHRFLHVSSCFPRKGVDVLLAAWAAAFRAGDPVRLVIKGFPNPHNEAAALLRALREDDPGIAPVELVDRDLDEAALLGLYADADTMVLPSRGEGYNLPAAEALAAGLRLIVTGAGGHMDFCTDADGPLPGVRLLRCRPAPSGSHVAAPGSTWLEPDRDDLVAALREAVAGRARMPPPPPPPALADAAAVADAYARLGTALLLTPSPDPVRVSWVSSWNVRCGVADYSRQLLDALAVLPGGPSTRCRVLCDQRTPAAPSEGDAYWPCWHAGQPDTAAPLAAAIAADDADAVLIQHQPGLLCFRTLAALVEHPALRRRVLLATLHNTRHLAELPGPERGRVVRALRRLDRVLVHTEADVAALRAEGVVDAVTLLPHGVARSLPPAAARILAAAHDTPVIGCYGFFLPGKGIDTLVEALQLLRLRWPRARLRLVNAEYGYELSRCAVGRCREQVAALGLAAEVEFHTDFLAPAQSQALLAGCDLLALPYRPSLEASSAALRGAMTAGVPVAVTPIALFDEAGDAVFRFDDIDAHAVADGLDRLLLSADLRAGVRDRAQGWIADRSWPDIARRLDGLIAGLVRTRALDLACEEGLPA